MLRWHSEIQLMLKRRRFVEDRDRAWLYYWDSPKDLGLFRKRHPGDCGHTRCLTCHSPKYWPDKNRANIKRNAIQDQLDW